jgi:hypothetical protein
VPRRAQLLLAALAACLVLAPAAAQARTAVRVGIGDQSVSMFDRSAFQRAKLKRVRYSIAWNAMDDDASRLAARAFVQRARRDGFSVLLHVSTGNYEIKKATLPSVAQYRSTVGRLVRYFRGLGVREFGAWNEVNHASQPTYRSPTRAAQFFRQMDRMVKPHCSMCAVVALDVLDQTGVERYMASWYRALSATYRRRATLVGIHNYGDVNRARTTFTRSIIRESHKHNGATRFWFTETGGIVRFGRSFPCSTSRAASRLKNMFELSRTYHSSGVERAYVYNWTGAGCQARFDAGLTTPGGSTRPAYTVLRQQLPHFLR